MVLGVLNACSAWDVLSKCVRRCIAWNVSRGEDVEKITDCAPCQPEGRTVAAECLLRDRLSWTRRNVELTNAIRLALLTLASH